MLLTSRISPGNLGALPTFHAFQNHSYRLLWLGNFFSYVSRWLQMTLLSWLVLELTDSPWLVALVGFFGFAPSLLLGVIGGVLADRLDRRRLLMATQAMNFAAALAMTVLLHTGTVEYWHAYLIIMVSGMGWALDFPSRRSIIHDLLGRGGVTNAIALDSVGMHTSRMLGPALGGTLIVLAGVSGGYVVVTLFYLATVVLIRSMRLPQNLRPPVPSGAARSESASSRTGDGRDPGPRANQGLHNILGNLAEGFRYVRGQPAIMATLLITFLMNLMLFPYMQMVPVIARDVLGVGPGLMGMLMASEGLGALTGAVVIASAGNIRYQGRVYIGGTMLALLALLLFSFSRSYGVSVAILLVLGLGTACFATMQATIVMLLAKDEMRGRVLGVMSLAIGASPLGTLLVGWLASVVSPTFAIGLMSIMGIVSLAVVGLLMPSLRQRIFRRRAATGGPGVGGRAVNVTPPDDEGVQGGVNQPPTAVSRRHHTQTRSKEWQGRPRRLVLGSLTEGIFPAEVSGGRPRRCLGCAQLHSEGGRAGQELTRN